MKIVLIGFMGAGKSSVARILATTYGMPSIELDQQIVEYSSYSSIPEIFQEEGEEAFRALETQVCSSWKGEHHVVLSTGGGVVGSDENMQALISHQAIVVYLRASFHTLNNRVGDDPNRPLFSNVKKAQELFDSRQGLYEHYADIVVDTEERKPNDVATEIVDKLPPSRSSISAHTQVCMILGDPVSHSLSPTMHNAAYKALGIDDRFVFVAHRVKAPDLEQAIQGARVLGIRGITCTIPHKAAVIPFLDEIDPVAAQMGAVNTVVNESGHLKGYNTDWLGVVEPLSQRTSLPGKRVAVLGAGGAARAAVFGMKERGASVMVFNRTLSKAKQLAEEVSGAGYGLEDIEQIKECDIIIQTTSVGMSPRESESLVPIDCLQSHHIVMDAVYTPRHTRLLQEASQQGATIIPGTEMFLHQGLAQFELYTGQQAPKEVMLSVME